MDGGAGAAIAEPAGTSPVPWVPGDTLFNQGVLCALLRWDSIKFALNERIRDEGDEIVLWMCVVIAEFIAKRKGDVEPTDLSDYILDIMDAEFSMTIDEVETAFLVKQVLRFWKDCHAGETEDLTTFMKKTAETRLFDEVYGRFMAPAHQPKKPEPDDVAAEVAKMGLEPAGTAALAADDDGWEVVSSKKKKK